MTRRHLRPPPTQGSTMSRKKKEHVADIARRDKARSSYSTRPGTTSTSSTCSRTMDPKTKARVYKGASVSVSNNGYSSMITAGRTVESGRMATKTKQVSMRSSQGVGMSHETGPYEDAMDCTADPEQNAGPSTPVTQETRASSEDTAASSAKEQKKCQPFSQVRTVHVHY